MDGQSGLARWSMCVASFWIMEWHSDFTKNGGRIRFTATRGRPDKTSYYKWVTLAWGRTLLLWTNNTFGVPSGSKSSWLGISSGSRRRGCTVIYTFEYCKTCPQPITTVLEFPFLKSCHLRDKTPYQSTVVVFFLSSFSQQCIQKTLLLRRQQYRPGASILLNAL